METKLPRGVKAKLARQLGVTPQFVGQLLKCDRHASLPMARALESKIGMTHLLWMRGGEGEAASRRAAVEAWAARQ